MHAEIEELMLAGQLLSNCAFNLKQDARLDAREQKSLSEAQQRWDAAARAYRDRLSKAIEALTIQGKG